MANGNEQGSLPSCSCKIDKVTVEGPWHPGNCRSCGSLAVKTSSCSCFVAIGDLPNVSVVQVDPIREYKAKD